MQCLARILWGHVQNYRAVIWSLLLFSSKPEAGGFWLQGKGCRGAEMEEVGPPEPEGAA